MRKFLVLAVLCALPGCSSASKPDTASTPAVTLAAVRAAIVAGNYGEAAQSAQSYVAAHPKDPDGYFEDARAEALAGNQGRAFDALTKAVDNGLGNAEQALNDPAFDTIRSDDRFVALAQRATPAPHNADAVSAGSGADRVNISQHGGDTQIQAGDVKLNTNF